MSRTIVAILAAWTAIAGCKTRSAPPEAELKSEEPAPERMRVLEVLQKRGCLGGCHRSADDAQLDLQLKGWAATTKATHRLLGRAIGERLHAVPANGGPDGF